MIESIHGNSVEESLLKAYADERERLLALAQMDEPQGEYGFPVFGEGNTAARTILIGEAPGAEETKQNRPFVGKAGKQLDELILIFGVHRSELFITNVVKYRPVIRSAKTIRNRTPVPAEVKASLPLLKREIELIRPSVLLTLGNTPLKAVCQMFHVPAPAIGEAHGKELTLRVSDESVIRFIPLYHPASGIYNRSLIEIMEQDAEFAGEVLRGNGCHCTE
ncbi:MAG: uracil-DNA glycosylase [Eubacteriales bacterium]|nr:uracil-DNA glycosylase [Eubacteriales bacterium]